ANSWWRAFLFHHLAHTKRVRIVTKNSFVVSIRYRFLKCHLWFVLKLGSAMTCDCWVEKRKGGTLRTGTNLLKSSYAISRAGTKKEFFCRIASFCSGFYVGRLPNAID